MFSANSLFLIWRSQNNVNSLTSLYPPEVASTLSHNVLITLIWISIKLNPPQGAQWDQGIKKMQSHSSIKNTAWQCCILVKLYCLSKCVYSSLLSISLTLLMQYYYRFAKSVSNTHLRSLFLLMFAVIGYIREHCSLNSFLWH